MQKTIKKTIINNSIYLELITEIASKIVENEFGYSYIENENNDLVYSEEQQECFNSTFDFIECILNKTGNIFSE